MAVRTEISPSERVRSAEGDDAHSIAVEPSGAAEGSGPTAQRKSAGLNNGFAELKRRRVFRALVAYGIASFAVLQIIEPIMHGAHWPEIVLSYVVGGLAAGCHVAHRSRVGTPAQRSALPEACRA